MFDNLCFMVDANNSLNIGIWFGSIDGAHTEAQLNRAELVLGAFRVRS